MNLFEKLVERTLARSPILLKVATTMETMANEVHNLATATALLAQTVQSHHSALLELYARQGLVMKAIKSNSPDMKMPEPNDKDKASKPN